MSAHDLWPGAAAADGQRDAAKQAREDQARNAERVTTIQPFADAPSIERVPE